MKLALTAAAATGVQVGLALVASQAVVADVGVGRLGFLRYAVALLFLLPFALRVKSSTPIKRRDILPVALLGIGQFGLLIAFINLAVLYTSSVRVSLVFATLPLVTLGVVWILFRTRVQRADLAAIVLTIMGVAILLGGDALTGSLGGAELAGLAYAGLATLTGAICSALYKPYLNRYGVIKVSVIAMAASLIPLGIMALLEGGGLPMANWSLKTGLLVFFIGLSSGIGYLLWLYALGNAPAGLVTAFLALSPITAVASSILYLDSLPSQSQLAALILVIGGLLAMAFANRSAAAQSSQ